MSTKMSTTASARMRSRLARATATAAVAALAVGGAHLISAPAAAAASATVGDFAVAADAGDPAAGAKVTGYSGPGGAVEIPAAVMIDGVSYAVSMVGFAAFRDKSVTAVTIPATVTEISARAFEKNQLRSVNLPDALKSIGEYAFDQNELTAIALGPNVESVGASAFRYNGGLREVVFTGPAPTVVDWTDKGSFGTWDNMEVTLYYPWRWGASETPGGYTAPLWQGYAAQAEFTVSFEIGGGSAPTAQQIRAGGRPQPPVEPTRVGMDFGGWATSASGEQDFDFTATPTTDVAAHARWSPTPGNPQDPAAPAGSLGSLGALGSLFAS